MKQIIIAITLMLIAVLVSLSILSINSYSTRKTETEEAVADALQQTLEEYATNNEYMYDDKEEMMAVFVKNFLVDVESDGNFTFELMGIDIENGMMDVKVTEEFTYPNGLPGSVTVRRMAICDV